MISYNLQRFPDHGALARSAAAAWVDRVSRSAASHHVALSGGRIARIFFKAVVLEARQQESRLAKVQFYWADERLVPPNHPESNYFMAEQSLFVPLGIPAPQIHRLQGELPAAEAVSAANLDITAQTPRNARGTPILDLVILGLGEDGHVASLFPHAPQNILDDPNAYLKIENSPKPPPCRLSLSYAAIAAANDVWVLISGQEKEAALRESLSANGETPLARVLQRRPATELFTDINI